MFLSTTRVSNPHFSYRISLYHHHKPHTHLITSYSLLLSQTLHIPLPPLLNSLVAKAKKKALEVRKRKAKKAKAEKARAKKKADKEAKPKRARSAYTFFVSANRSKIKNANPDYDFKALAKAVADAWANCSGSQREHYERLAEDDKERSIRERAAFRSQKPKRAMSAYMFFVKENRKHIKTQHPEMTFAEVGKALGHAWKHCQPSHKERYEAMAQQDKIRAQKEREEKKQEQTIKKEEE